MIKNVEIEFKTKIDEATYLSLLEEFSLENNIFRQVNYYFDNDSFDLSKQKIVLRIRQKGDTHYKVTLKSQHEQQAFESHILLSVQDAKEMIKDGFYTREYFDDIDLFVTFKAQLINDRANAPYADGIIFLDRCEYHGIVDFEVEYEFDNYKKGYQIFNQFLTLRQIPMLETKRKSERALSPLLK